MFQSTKEYIYNVLLFADGGWMVDQTQVMRAIHVFSNRTIFAKNAADRPKNRSGTIGTKTILGEMAT